MMEHGQYTNVLVCTHVSLCLVNNIAGVMFSIGQLICKARYTRYHIHVCRSVKGNMMSTLRLNIIVANPLSLLARTRMCITAYTHLKNI